MAYPYFDKACDWLFCLLQTLALRDYALERAQSQRSKEKRLVIDRIKKMAEIDRKIWFI